MATDTLPVSQTLFSNKRELTNMPFSDGKTLVFCQSNGTSTVSLPTGGTIWKTIRNNKALAERMKNLPRESKVTYRPWKLAYCDLNTKNVRPIFTGLPSETIERCPTFYHEQGTVHLSFTAGSPAPEGFRYLLYTCSGPDFDHLDEPRAVFPNPVYFGFVNQHHICWGTMSLINLSEKATGHVFRLQTSFHRICSVNFLAEEPSKLLITGLINKEHDCRAVLYDLNSETVTDVSVEGSIYKSTMHRNEVIYARRKIDEFEERELCLDEADLSPSSIQILKDK